MSRGGEKKRRFEKRDDVQGLDRDSESVVSRVGRTVKPDALR